MKNQELEKLLREVENQENPAVHTIHNWLCDQEDNELFERVGSENKTILQAVQYCINNAHKVRVGNAAIVDNETVFKWVREYYLSDEANVEVMASAKITSNSKSIQERIAQAEPKVEDKKKSKTKSKEIRSDEYQISLLDLL